MMIARMRCTDLCSLWRLKTSIKLILERVESISLKT